MLTFGWFIHELLCSYFKVAPIWVCLPIILCAMGIPQLCSFCGMIGIFFVGWCYLSLCFKIFAQLQCLCILISTWYMTWYMTWCMLVFAKIFHHNYLPFQVCIMQYAPSPQLGLGLDLSRCNCLHVTLKFGHSYHNTHICRGLSGEKFLRGKQSRVWSPRGWVREGGTSPSREEHGKLMYNTVSIFSMSHLIDTWGFRTNTCSGSMEYN